MMVPTLCSVFFKPLIEDYLEFFYTPLLVPSNYTLSLQEKEKGKGKGRRKTVFKRIRLVISSN